MKRFLALAILMLLVAAATATSGAIKITSDKFVVDDVNHFATFTGKVVVTRGTALTVWAAKVLVDYGDGGPSNIKTFTASGGVRIKTPDQDATGDTAIYDPVTQLLHLSGHVMVINGTGTVGSADLVVNLKDNTTVFTGGKGGRVTGVFTAQ